jgi:hypothetical protein
MLRPASRRARTRRRVRFPINLEDFAGVLLRVTERACFGSDFRPESDAENDPTGGPPEATGPDV